MNEAEIRRQMYEEHCHQISCCGADPKDSCFGWVDFEEKAATMPLDAMAEEHREAIDCCDNFSSPEWPKYFPGYAAWKNTQLSRPEESGK